MNYEDIFAGALSRRRHERSGAASHHALAHHDDALTDSLIAALSDVRRGLSLAFDEHLVAVE